MLRITDTISLSDEELTFTFIRSSGPGGQNVNKVATAAQLRFNVRSSPSLTQSVKRRLIKLGGRRVTDEGVLVLDARRFRTQQRNREDAMARLVALIRKAAVRPKHRVATRPSAAARKRRLTAKRQRSETKNRRGRVQRDE